MKLQELIRDGYLFLDGAMGTELQAVSYTHLKLPTNSRV